MEIGRVLDDRYEIADLVAEGATSTVWAARDRETGDEVAIKAISLDRAGWRAEVRDRFLQEARLLSLSPHENLVGLRDVRETDDGYLYLVLDLLRGETLAERIARPPRLSPGEAARIAAQVSRGLAALHAHGIVHRDLKPGNMILVGEGGAPAAKIIDLGISKVRAAAADEKLHATLTATGQVLGTPQYMSYEQAIGDRDIDARSDVWSIGVVLYEMLTGRTPFPATNLNAALAAIRRETPPSVRQLAPTIPVPLAAIVQRCLEKERDKRFADAAELADALEAFRALPPTAHVGLPRRRVAAMLGVSVLVALGLLGVLAARARGTSTPSPESSASASSLADPPIASDSDPQAAETSEPSFPATSVPPAASSGSSSALPDAAPPGVSPSATASPRRSAPHTERRTPRKPPGRPGTKAPATKIDSAGF